MGEEEGGSGEVEVGEGGEDEVEEREGTVYQEGMEEVEELQMKDRNRASALMAHINQL